MSDEAKTVKLEVPIKLGLIGGGIYMAIGILYHLLFGDYEVFSWADPWLYAGMFLWPFFVFGWVIVWGIGIVVVLGGAYLLFVELPEERRKKAVIRERRQALEEEREQRRRELAKATPPATD